MSTRQYLPEVVKRVRAIIARQPLGRLSDIATRLINDTPDCIKMWRAIEKRVAEPEDDLWVWGFLRAASDASDLPEFHYLPKRDRLDLANRITKLATDLNRALEVHRLDVQIVKMDNSTNFPGFRIYEDFSAPNQAWIDRAEEEKLKVTDLVRHIAARSKKVINDEPVAGKSGVNVHATRFVRIMAKRNAMLYHMPLNLVIATAANLLFATNYTAADVRRFTRRPIGN